MQDYENHFTPGDFLQFLVEREVSSEQLNEVRMDFMPGFEIKWSITSGNNELSSPIPCFADSDTTGEFRKFVNLILLTGVEHDLVWNIMDIMWT